MRVYNTLFLRCLGLAYIVRFCCARQHGAESFNDSPPSQRLAVVIPTYHGDLSRTVSSLERWPTAVCSPFTRQKMDLVLYYAEGDEDNLAVTSAAHAISSSAGKCFAKTRTVYANLNKEDNIYPKGPSAMFYKMYLDAAVRPHFAEYDALAVIEWDVLVTSERAFEQLYHSAFNETPDFWVKGSRMEGTDFHSNANSKEMWNVLGHINGNAIYNNNDQAFMEYVRYTHARWELDYPFDVALWLTVSDFPYSWPLWQRYSGKFVATNLISNVGREHIDHDMVSDAIAAETLFIHGSYVDEGNIASIEATKSSRRALRNVESAPNVARGLQKWREEEKWRKIEKWKTLEKWRRDYGTEDVRMCLSGCTNTSNDGTKGRACDLSCESGEPYGTLGCEARQGRFGANCRACYNDVTKARRQDTPENRAIMCDTLEPVPTAYDARSLGVVDTESAPNVARGLQKWREEEKWRKIEKWKTLEKWRRDYGTEVVRMCLSGCTNTSNDGTKGRVCDLSCESGEPYGTLGCEARQGRFGANCRVCYNDVTKAHRQDTPENRAIMCDTLEPVPTAYDARSLGVVDTESAPNVARGLQKWREEEKWRKIEKWKTLEKWRRDYGTEVVRMCLSGCTNTSNDGTKGRVCDLSCESGEPYGTLGCEARQGRFGANCRACYNDVTKARRQDTPENRAIMCDTLEPVPTAYDARSLGIVDTESAPNVARGLQKWREEEKWRKIEKWKTLEKWRRDYGTEVVRMCLSGCTNTSNDGTKGRVCDLSCESGEPYGTLGCEARQGRFGPNCRACYNDVTKARRQDTPENRAIMCDTLEPVPTAYDARSLGVVDTESAPNVARGLQKWREEEKWRKIEKWKTLEKWRRDYGTEVVRMCLSGCTNTSNDGTKGRVCDLSCESGEPYGTLGCEARQGRFGANCRACYNDVTKARRQDTPENRAIMCDTLEPVPTAYDARSLGVVDTESAPNVARGLQKWREEEKWRKIEKWKTLEKWRRDYGTEVVRMCLSGCTNTSNDGTKGRVCDLSCESGEPYGTLGCEARQGRFGANCRACYNDVTKARRQDTPENRAIMCDTLEPVPTAYDARSLGIVDTESAPNVARGLQKWREEEKWRKIEKWKTLEKWRRDYGTEVVRMCLSGCTNTSNDGTKGRVCDLSCESGEPYGTLGCETRQGRFGANCRACYNDVTKARRQDTPENRAIMCDTLEPVPTAYDARSLGVVDTESAPNVARGLQKWREEEKWRKIEKWKTLEKWRRDYGTEVVRMCLSGCTNTSNDGTKGRVCDLSCESGEPYGTLGCEARQGRFGPNCRACYNDVTKARRQDTPENRAIMCDTLEPVPTAYDARSLGVVDTESAPNVARGLQKWREEEKWRKIEKWKTLEKWRRDYGTEVVRMCLSGCTNTSNDGTKGRVCDLSCESGEPYGTLGCEARQGRFGANCRACYNDVTKARRQDTPENRAIMCDTLEPVPTAYDARSLAVVDTESAPSVARGLQKWREEEKWRKIEKWKTLEKWRRDYGTEDVRMCLSGCTNTSNDGTKSRVCDLSCESGEPYGTLGCEARQGRFGTNCRACYNDVTKARRQDTPENRAIMCDTLEPVPTAYDARSLAVVDIESAPNVARGLQKWREEEKWRKIEKWKTLEKWRGDYGTEIVRMCLSGCTNTSNDGTKGRVCDLSCESGEPYGTLGCEARQGRFGTNCRACYNDATKARRQDTPENRAIMCATLEPVPTAYDVRSLAVIDTESAPNVARGLQKWREEEKWRKIEKWRTLEKWRRDYGTEDVRMCLSGCTNTSNDGTKGRVCDLSCESGEPYGTLGCGARQGRFGANCRVCYNDVTKARRQDTPENRAIMCDTLEPVPIAYDARSLAVVDTESAPNVARGLQKWREEEKWRKIEKWKTLEKWRRDYGTEDVRMCLSGCTNTSDDGTRGRVCDLSCESGEPYGTLGCEARQGRFGTNCRACYNDVTKARRQDTPENRAIMCDTLEPVPFVYDIRSLASASGRGSAVNRARGLRRNQNHEQNDGPDDGGVDGLIEKAALYPYTHDLVRHDLCAFVAGFAHEVAVAEVAVTSILQFVPGVQVVIAAEEASLDAYKSSVGIYPGVTVHSTPNASTASLFADDFCGPSTSLIYYVKPRSVLFRTFTSKDTHSPTGDLLVVYSNSRLCYRESALARQTSAMLGFEAPTFTCGTDLMLPVRANADLREVLASDAKTKVGDKDDVAATALAKLGEIKDVSAVPQMLAAVAYSRKTPKVWFIDPQAWVSEHLFKAASIWEIPLVKPQFSCSLALDAAHSVDDVASVLQHNLDFFTQGGTCENGIMIPV